MQHLKQLVINILEDFITIPEKEITVHGLSMFGMILVATTFGVESKNGKILLTTMTPMLAR